MTKYRLATESTSPAVIRASSSHMITVLTVLHDLIHLGQFSAQRQKKKKKGLNKSTEILGKMGRKTNRETEKM